ncbi:glutathione S-transferase family protein [Phenylobacterium sp. Root700]|uniref:glutathione S-transferase family protein n=1 Tax=Phenylobacterium sp. Root700 TaxID=1736591 RepID=UPI0006F9613C|nr:glutathione S-transferase family protein [Phenylobacterium sp. Root700]KRB52531.1 glutathione S-transferase [Phenylobacterium sp. Root700]
MTLKLHLHPFASYCQKVIIAFYENGTPFEACFVDLGEEVSRSAFLALWPIGKMPVLQDEARGETIPETSIIIEYLELHYPGAARLIPTDPDMAWRTRLRDRMFDLYVQGPMQAIVADRIRPDGGSDPASVVAARAQLRTVYGVLEKDLAGKTWAMGEAFTLADCAAAPALFYSDRLEPFGDDHPILAGYFKRLMARPSVARTVEEARPYRHLFPGPELLDD